MRNVFPYDREGFTLIELSIVLVIIGLIVGGVLVGQDLIRAAAVRAQITQIEKYNTAVNTFRDKYGGLPGDLAASNASQFGFSPRGPNAGEGDGNGLLEGIVNTSPDENYRFSPASGENIMFWEDLSFAHLIDQSFSTASAAVIPSAATFLQNIGLYFPTAAIGQNNYVYVWSGGGALPAKLTATIITAFPPSTPIGAPAKRMDNLG